MPNRYLRESYIESESVSSLSWQAEVTWTRLIVTVDDWGRCEANIRLLRPRLFPLRLERVREAELQRWLEECELAGLLRRYEVNGKSYLQMIKWERGRAATSKYPEPHEIADGRLQPYTNANGGMRMLPTPTPTPTPTNDSDTDTDSDSRRGEGDELPLGVVFPVAIDTPEFRAAWDDWLAYRRERKLATLKPRSLTAQLDELAGWGAAAAVESIRDSVRNQWQGLFAPKGKNGTPRPKSQFEGSF